MNLYLNISRNNVNFVSTILFTNEATFQRHCLINLRNPHSWAEENPHAVCKTKLQHKFSLNVWAGIVGNTLLAPFILPRRIDAAEYLQFLNEHLPALLEDTPLDVRQAMWYMHDGAPMHSTITVKQRLDLKYPSRWIGRGNETPIFWPARSPDLTPIDFFLGDIYKKYCLLYST